ncbi:MAG: hypothetical protein SGI71_10550 [Verrucomicrobiota bacterium]|nr:hypothetical protein [Verrucomicrobiota bacterium]
MLLISILAGIQFLSPNYVVAQEQAPYTNSTVDATDRARMERFNTCLVGVVVIQCVVVGFIAAAEKASANGDLFGAIAHSAAAEIARAGRDEAILSAVIEAMPTLTTDQASVFRLLLSMAIDGKLTSEGIAEEFAIGRVRTEFANSDLSDRQVVEMGILLYSIVSNLKK